MENDKKKTRERKRKSRALLKEFRADCEEVFQKDISEVINVTSNDQRTLQNIVADNDAHEQDIDFEYMEDSTLTEDMLEAEKSTDNLRDEVLTAHLEDSLNSDNEPQPSRSVPGTNPEIGELQRWAIDSNINHASLDKLLSILRQRLLCDLPKSAATFLGTRLITYDIIDMNDHSLNKESGQFVYFGIAKGLEKCIFAVHRGDIELIINIDGLPLTKSGKKTFWPILCKVYYKPDIYKPFVVGIYCGNSKPENIEEYLYQFVDEINQLQRDGISLHGKVFNVFLKGIPADTPARSYCKCTKGHGGYSACERCTVYGERVRVGKGSRIVYPGTGHMSRNDESFRERNDPEHHTGNSPLENIVPSVDMTTIFVLDFMHLVCVGAMKKLLEMLMFGPLKVRIAVRNRIKISRRMLSLKACIPTEFQRKPTSVSWLYKWKATEFRFFLLYCGPIVLKNLLPQKLYNHFLLLHAAFRILCSEDLAVKFSHIAKAYLEKFVLALPLLYGEESQVINMHNLLHIADDVEILGCDLNKVNCFSFESYLGSIKRTLRTPNKPLEQFCRRNSEKDMLFRGIPDFPKKFVINKSTLKNGQVNISNLTLNFSTTITTKTPNNVVLLNNRCVMEIQEIYGEDSLFSSLRIVGKVWKTKKSIYSYPTKSSFFQIWELSTNVPSVVATYSITCVVKKLIKMKLSFKSCGPVKVFFLSLLHE